MADAIALRRHNALNRLRERPRPRPDAERATPGPCTGAVLLGLAKPPRRARRMVGWAWLDWAWLDGLAWISSRRAPRCARAIVTRLAHHTVGHATGIVHRNIAHRNGTETEDRTKHGNHGGKHANPRD